MADRVSSDHPSVRTVDARIGRRGATRRPRLEVPVDAGEASERAVLPVDEVVRVVLDGRTRHAVARRSFDGDGLVVDGVYDSPRLARAAEADRDRLPGWLAAHGLGIGRSVPLDVVVPGVQYGLRAPGETTVYTAAEAPGAALRGIAAALDGDRGDDLDRT